jgi:hypothetical protein
LFGVLLTSKNLIQITGKGKNYFDFLFVSYGKILWFAGGVVGLFCFVVFYLTEKSTRSATSTGVAADASRGSVRYNPIIIGTKKIPITFWAMGILGWLSEVTCEWQ